jgi:dTDP-4-amino-4,6-dideoxygalactose transaminase
MTVPFLDLKAQYLALHDEIGRSIQDVLDSCAFSGGPFVERFEKEFAGFTGSRHAIGVGNGTEALSLALLASGIGDGDEVITVPNSFIATAEAISSCGARPVFVDVDERTFTMDPRLVAGAITARTRAVIPVHLYGQAADMDPIVDIARERGLTVIEDACQAHGATYKGRRAGSIGKAAAFSFYPGKNLGAYGEAGAVTTDDETLARKIRMLRDHGQRAKYYHDVIGMNGRMDGIQGAVLAVKLGHLAAWNQARARHAELYDGLLRGHAGIVTPHRAAHAGHVYHIYAVLVPRRDEVLNALKDAGIGCGIHYPVPIHLQEAYRSLGLGAGAFPVSERCALQELSLPMFAELTDEQIRYTADRLIRAVESLR